MFTRTAVRLSTPLLRRSSPSSSLSLTVAGARLMHPATTRHTTATASAGVTNLTTSPTPSTSRESRETSAKGELRASGFAKNFVIGEDNYRWHHPIWSTTDVDSVTVTHRPIVDNVDRAAYWTIRTLRFNFDWMSGYALGPIKLRLTAKKALTRVCFLETVAGVPGSIGGILRHLASLRRMQRDGGWIHSLFEEAENERMHLLTFLQLKQPTPAFRALVFLTQGVFFNFFWVAYLVSPRYCHRLVGYLEEEAVRTYTHLCEEIKAGNIPEFEAPAPEIARKYWKLADDATLYDMFLHVRADESHHRDQNHAFADASSQRLALAKHQDPTPPETAHPKVEQ